MVLHSYRTEDRLFESVSIGDIVRHLVVVYSGVRGGAKREYLPAHYTERPLGRKRRACKTCIKFYGLSYTCIASSMADTQPDFKFMLCQPSNSLIQINSQEIATLTMSLCPRLSVVCQCFSYLPHLFSQ